jgi:hypothetical protein
MLSSYSPKQFLQELLRGVRPSGGPFATVPER